MNSIKAYFLRKLSSLMAHATGQQFHEIQTKLAQMEDQLSHALIPRQQTIEWLANENRMMMQESIRRMDQWYLDLFHFNPQLKHRVKGNESINLTTQHPICEDSNDHLFPESTAEGTGRHPRFVNTCEQHFQHPIDYLDIGCGGGGLVFEFASHGHQAIGIDGSNHCKKGNIGFWPILSENFFTCDATQPFTLKNNNNAQTFHVVTMYEALEHIPESSLDGLFENIHRHLDDNGFFLGSVSLLEYRDGDVVYHVTLQPKTWWEEVFARNGLKFTDDHPFDFLDHYRGVGRGYQDPHHYAKNPETGFHFVAVKS